MNYVGDLYVEGMATNEPTREAEGQGLQEAAVIRKRERAGSYTACI